jgi:hypothetical protein
MRLTVGAAALFSSSSGFSVENFQENFMMGDE